MKNCCFKQESILRNSKLNICKIESFLNPEITWYLKNYKANSFVTQQSLLRRDLQTTIYIYIYTHTHIIYVYVYRIYIWASPVAQTVKYLLALQETQVQSLDWKDPLE